MNDRALVVQADRTVLLETQHPRFAEVRDRLARFAELEKSPEYVHFYRITPISIWNAAALGDDVEAIVGFLCAEARYPVPAALLDELRAWHGRYGSLRFLPGDDAGTLLLAGGRAAELDEVLAAPEIATRVAAEQRGDRGIPFAAALRGELKQALLRLGYPVEDLGGYRDGARLTLRLRRDGFALRPYQEAAAQAFHAGGGARGGCGVVVLPCGAGKTVVGMAVMGLLQTQTLILTTNTVAVRQWIRELLDKTDLGEERIGEYTGDSKEIKPVTVATYQILTWRRGRLAAFEHFGIFDRADWGLVIYDEVHLLPAPVFRATAGLQARRRLGLTATLVREDGREDEVFSLVGPKRYELPWRELERDGWLAAARCVEVRVPMDAVRMARYRSASARQQHQIAAANERKQGVVGALLRLHAGDRVLVIGQYLDQLRALAGLFDMPLITGRTPTPERLRLFADFREGRLARLMVSKVGNFAIDLPDANVAIQVSGTYGSRQEEAQRLGRILRPKSGGGGAVFYSVVSAESRDQEHAARRQLFLTEQGYRYEIVEAEDLEDLGGVTRHRRPG